MRYSLLTLWIAAIVMLAYPLAAHAGPRTLTNEELDQITAGDICGDFGISGSCAISYVDVWDSSGQTTTYTTTPLPQTFSSTTTTTTSGGTKIKQTVTSNSSTFQSNKIITKSWKK